MIEFQGRKVQSQIGHRHKTGISKTTTPPKQRYQNKNQSNISMPPAFEKRAGKKLRPKGTGKNVPLERKKWCAVCAKHITDVSQHNGTAKHTENSTLNVRWKYCTECGTAWQESQSHVCVASRGIKMWTCSTCDISFPSTPDSVHAHENSAEHIRLRSYDANQSRPDGQALANAQRQRNASSDQLPKKRASRKK